jgi:hypothetical protein
MVRKCRESFRKILPKLFAGPFVVEDDFAGQRRILAPVRRIYAEERAVCGQSKGFAFTRR